MLYIYICFSQKGENVYKAHRIFSFWLYFFLFITDVQPTNEYQDPDMGKTTGEEESGK